MNRLVPRMVKHAKTLEWLGCLTGVVAATLIALNLKLELMGYAFYLVCSAAWIAVGVAKGMKGMVVMQLVMAAITLLGLYRYSL